MTHEQIMAIRHLILPGDRDRVEQIAFDLAELKTLQGIVVDHIRHDAEVNNSCLPPASTVGRKTGILHW